MSNHTAMAVAKILDVHTSTVTRICKQHGIGTRHGQTWLLTEADIDLIRAVLAARKKQPNTPT